jgi:hypothetical protein
MASINFDSNKGFSFSFPDFRIEFTDIEFKVMVPKMVGDN